MGHRDKKEKREQRAKEQRRLGNLFHTDPPLGGSIAEREPSLSEYFINEEIELRPIRQDGFGLAIYVGPKGIGKSAIQKLIEARQTTFAPKIISLRPKDLAIWTISQADQLRSPIIADIAPRWLHKELWNFVFITEVLRREHSDFTGVWNLLKQVDGDFLRMKRFVERGMQANTVADRFLGLIEEIQLEAEGKIKGVGVSASAKLKPSANATGATIFGEMHKIQDQLKSKLKHEYIILLDDLDENWSGSPTHIALLEGLFGSFRNLIQTEKLSFVVSLRHDIYRALKPEEPDKLRQFKKELRHTHEDIDNIIGVRVNFFQPSIAPESWKAHLLAPGTKLGTFWKIIGDNPRRAIQILEAAIKDCKDLPNITQQRLDPILVRLSKEFLSDLDSLYSHSHPGIQLIAGSLRKVEAEFNCSRAELVCVDLLEHLEKNPEFHSKAGWVKEHAAAGSVPLLTKLLEIGLLWYKPRRDSEPKPYAIGDVLDEKMWVAVNPTYAVGLGLSKP